jgi:pyruvate formate lyase activating enzyme
MTADEVLAEVLRDAIFYDESGGGVTFSGGEPLAQPKFLMALLAACRASGIRTAVDTSGYAPQEDLLAAAALADLILYDLKTVDDDRHRRYTGVSNETILENLKALGRSHGNIWVRVPLVPGFNDDVEQLEAVGQFAAAIPGVRQLNILPYHKTGVHKWAGLRKPPPPDAAPASAEAIDRAAARLRQSGFNVLVGG